MKGLVIIAENVNQYSPLVLAYIGDAVFEIYVRRMLVSQGNARVDMLHKKATEYVKSSAQSASYRRIESGLTEEEITIYKRGRNAKSTPPKNADVVEYHTATGLEALIGYIYLSGDINRLDEIMDMILKQGDVDNEK